MRRSLSILIPSFFLLLPGSLLQSQNKSLGSDLVPPGTPYSPGVLSGDTLYISGLQGTDPRTHELPKEFNEEAKTCLDNVGRVLKEGGMKYSDVVSVQIFLADMSQFATVNAIYKTFFKNPLPSRTTLQVAKLSAGAHIEIAAIARKQIQVY
jgi:2-iminobutanoate/2-iminopropanoate deaminase